MTNDETFQNVLKARIVADVRAPSTARAETAPEESVRFQGTALAMADILSGMESE